LRYNPAVSRREYQLQSAPGLWPPTWPMGLTMLRLMLLPVFLWALVAHGRGSPRPHLWLPITIFAVMALTDKLDGFLARRLGQTSRLGALLDPVADKLLVGCAVILLSFDKIAGPDFALSTWVVVAIYGKDLLTAIGATILLALAGKVTVAARPLGKASTVLQLSLVLAVLVAPGPSSSRFAFWLHLVHALSWAVAALAVASCGDYIVQGWRQFAQHRQARAATCEPAILKSER